MRMNGGSVYRIVCDRQQAFAKNNKKEYNNKIYFHSTFMTVDMFIQSATNLQGLLPEMIESLTAVAQGLTDEQRASAMEELRKLSDEAVMKEHAIEDAFRSQDNALKAFRKQRVPEIKTIVTKKEQSDADTLLSTIDAL